MENNLKQANKCELECKLKQSEAQSNKLRDQIDSMNAKFDDWKDRYDELNGRLADMDRIEAKIKTNSEFN